MAKHLVLKPDGVMPDLTDYEAATIRQFQRDFAEIGVIASPEVLYIAWEKYSDSMAAGWLIHSTNAEYNRKAILEYTNIEEKEP